MRIAIGQLWQETNTFNPMATTRADFEAFGILRGAALIEQMAQTNELGGFIQSLRAWQEQPEIVGLARLPAWPGGRATAETCAWLREELIGALRRAMPVEAVLLALHGALAAEGCPDVEGLILRAVRDAVGPTIPVVATLDLHANITREMAAAAQALVLYHTAPHVDVFETGQRGARVLARILGAQQNHPRSATEGAGYSPITAFAKVPCVLPAERANTEAQAGVSVDLKRRLQAIEALPGVLTAGIATVQPWLDVPELGSAAVVTTEGDPALARELCSELADALWQRRREYLPDLVSVSDAVAQAHQQCHAGLVVLSDAADATTSGAPGDSVWILEELLKRDWPRPVLATLVSPEIVAAAERLGTSQTWSGEIGGVRDRRFGKRIAVQAQVENLFDARFVLNGHLGKNLPIDMGRSAVLAIGPVRLVVTSRSGPHFAPELFQAALYDPFAAAVVVAKSPCGFRAVYAARAAAIYSVKAPGCAPSDFWNYPYDQIDRPLWPWDEIDQWRAQPVLFPIEPRG